MRVEQGSERCARKTNDDQVHQLLALSVDEKLELGKAVLQAVLQKDNGLRVKMESAGDYDKSFGGTKQDTQASDLQAQRCKGTLLQLLRSLLLPSIGVVGRGPQGM